MQTKRFGLVGKNISYSFSKSYFEARQKFLGAAHHAGLQVELHIHLEASDELLKV